ncbi:MAG TPA: dTDP-4-dehydrorhamnose reductase [Terriglobales bacterium]|nr:dTDP-4-dehydrorhamnose reductase [Terriglobales bacterium]
MRQRIMLLGESGQVGYELRRELSPLGEVTGFARTAADLACHDQLRSVIRNFAPNVIVNAAAYTAVDAAESHEEEATAINATAVGVIGTEAAALDASVVHFSTDYVFDGNASSPYSENAQPNPINVYGRTKREGELLLTRSGAAHFILRTSWVFGTRGTNFLLSVLRRASQDQQLRIVCDQFGGPTWSRFLATTTAQILGELRGMSSYELQEASGIYNVTAAGQATWAEFAQAIVDDAPISEYGKRQGLEWLRGIQITPITTAEYPTPAKRPPYSVLSNDKLHRCFDLRLPHWREQLSLALN